MEKVKEVAHKATNQAKDVLHGGDKSTHGQAGAHNTHSTSTNAGPHDSNVANKADPRIDSDLDGSRNAGAAHTGTTHGGLAGNTAHTGTTHGTHHTGTHGGVHNTSTNAGPHDSNLANKADPRIDSDLDGSRNMGAAGNTTHTGTHHTGTHHTGGGVTGAGYGANTSTNAGHHNSNLANKADPRVDSDLDGSRNFGAAGNTTHTGTTHGTHHTGTTHGTHHTGTTHGTHHAGNVGNPNSSNAGPHGSNILNKVDPRVDSDLDGSKNLGAKSHNTTHAGGATSHTGGMNTGAGYGNTNTYGNTSTNAGPHDSNLANKADPRIDSDLDGSRNMGATNTGAHHTTGNTNY